MRWRQRSLSMTTDITPPLISSAYRGLSTGLRELAAQGVATSAPTPPEPPVEEQRRSAASMVVVPFARGLWEGLWLSTVGVCAPLVLLAVAAPLRDRI